MHVNGEWQYSYRAGNFICIFHYLGSMPNREVQNRFSPLSLRQVIRLEPNSQDGACSSYPGTNKPCDRCIH